MTDSDKIKTALTLCNCDIDELLLRCEECPYKRDDLGTCQTINPLYDDMLAYIEEHEARVYNIGDFYGETFGYLEYRSDRPGFSDFEPFPVLIADVSEDDDTVTVTRRSGTLQTMEIADMNKLWRIWSDYPTHKQILEAKWDD